MSSGQLQKIRKQVVGFDLGVVLVADGLADAVTPPAGGVLVGALGVPEGEALCDGLAEALWLRDVRGEGSPVWLASPASAGCEGDAESDTIGSTVAPAPLDGPEPPPLRSATTAPTRTTAAAPPKITPRRRPARALLREPLRLGEARLSRAPRRPEGRSAACAPFDGSHSALMAGP